MKSNLEEKELPEKKIEEAAHAITHAIHNIDIALNTTDIQNARPIVGSICYETKEKLYYAHRLLVEYENIRESIENKLRVISKDLDKLKGPQDD